MKDYLKIHPWKIIEEGFHPDKNKVSESIFSLGNGRIGQRANFEEFFSGNSLPGNYVGGVYYPDTTRVGWWKNGYPQYYAKVLNSANWNFIDVYINNERLDLAKQKTTHFVRELDMKSGILSRTCEVEMENGCVIKIESERFNSLKEKELGCISYNIKLIRGKANIKINAMVDFDVRNMDSNYNENFWYNFNSICDQKSCVVIANTKKTNFGVAVAQEVFCYKNTANELIANDKFVNEKSVGRSFSSALVEGESIQLFKFAAILSSLNHQDKVLIENAVQLAKSSYQKGYNHFKEAQKQIWEKKWQDIDIEIIGDDSAQQAIRFNIFQLHQTYSGDDFRLNIGPKGFTGEKYGGSTYWDTEAYCIPFYLSTAEESVAEALLIYRYKHLQKAIENAKMLGFKNGAALYPMVTMNGEECHNEWEITFEEIHRNGAIAYAIHNYIKYTGKDSYLEKYGLEVLIGISRFWEQRVHFSTKKNQYVMLGVTGPNEYENNVNNNWYTNYIAIWTLRFTIDSIHKLKKSNIEKYSELIKKINFEEVAETSKWQEIIDCMYLPYDEELGIILQQDNYLDKEQILVKDLDKKHLPLNQNWSWDRILRSCFIKQADVLQGLFFFQDQFDMETIRRNFLFYEERTVHESSLSPCVHAILAAKLDMPSKAYEMYLRTARLDLDDYNNDTEDGLHITSMAGSWMSVIKGFGGMNVKEGKLFFDPKLPEKWDSFNFKIKFRDSVIRVFVNKNGIKLENLSSKEIQILISDSSYFLKANSFEIIELINI